MATTQDNNKPIFIEFEAYQTPTIKEHKQSNIVFFGEDNMFPEKLIDYFNESPTNNAIISGKIGFVCGEGLVYESEQLERSVQVNAWLNDANDSETWNDVSKKLVTDYEIHNGFAIEILRTSSGLKYYHIDFSRIRVATEGGYYHSENWSKNGARNSRPTKEFIPPYIKGGSEERSLIYVAAYRPDLDYYPLPIYMGSLAAIDTDIEVNNYWANEIKNGFSGGTLLTFNNGVPQDPEKKKEVERDFNKKFKGSSNAGKLVINFAADKEHAPTIDSLNGNDLPQRYEQLSQTVQQNIFVGHRVTSPMIFGVKTEGQLGGRSEIAVAYEIFKKTYVLERQNDILNIINKLSLSDIGFGGIEFAQFEPVEQKLELSESTIVEHLSKSEIRELIALQTGMKLNAEEQLQKMSADKVDEELVKRFQKVGRNASDFDELLELDIDFNAHGRPMEFATEDLKSLDVDILKLIEGDQLSTTEIASILSVSILEVNKRIGILQKTRRIEKDGLNWGLLQVGRNILKIINLPVTKEELKIKYKYTLRSDAPPLKGKSRDFCRAMMSMERLWSREEIDLLRNDMEESGYAPQVTDVWLARGGWYRKPDTDISVPFCRHIWKQVIVKEKK